MGTGGAPSIDQQGDLSSLQITDGQSHLRPSLQAESNGRATIERVGLVINEADTGWPSHCGAYRAHGIVEI